MLLLGVDGGGTKTEAVLVDVGGRVFGRGEGGPVNVSWVGKETAAASTRQAVTEALKAANATPADVGHAYLGMASVDDGRMENAQHFACVMHELGFSQDRLTVENDVYPGMAAAIGLGPGAGVVAGTGFNAVAIARDGRRVHVPWYVAAHAPSRALGQQAAFGALMDLLGVGPPTEMTPLVMELLGVATARELEAWMSESRPSWEWGRLGPAVTDAARRGDRHAAEILRRAGVELGLAAVMVVRAAGLDEPLVACPVATIGGVFQAGALVTDAMSEVLQKSGVIAQLARPKMAPVGGAALLAAERAGVHSPSMLDRLIEHLGIE